MIKNRPDHVHSFFQGANSGKVAQSVRNYICHLERMLSAKPSAGHPADKSWVSNCVWPAGYGLDAVTQDFHYTEAEAEHTCEDFMTNGIEVAFNHNTQDATIVKPIDTWVDDITDKE